MCDKLKYIQDKLFKYDILCNEMKIEMNEKIFINNSISYSNWVN